MPSAVSFGHADVQRSPLIYSGHARFESARRRQVGVDRTTRGSRANTFIAAVTTSLAAAGAIGHRQLSLVIFQSACLWGTRVVNTGPIAWERDSVSAERRIERICPANSPALLEQPAIGIVVK